MAPRLPIYEIEQRIVSSVREHGRVIVSAPTGSGKSTQVPQMLLGHGLMGAGQVVVLQPRRLATRLLAARVAAERKTVLGGEVGYQIRFETVCGPHTRIRYVTEGVLLRQIVEDPELSGVSALLFDEFHERHLYGDISLERKKQMLDEGVTTYSVAGIEKEVHWSIVSTSYVVENLIELPPRSPSLNQVLQLAVTNMYKMFFATVDQIPAIFLEPYQQIMLASRLLSVFCKFTGADIAKLILPHYLEGIVHNDAQGNETLGDKQHLQAVFKEWLKIEWDEKEQEYLTGGLSGARVIRIPLRIQVPSEEDDDRFIADSWFSDIPLPEAYTQPAAPRVRDSGGVSAGRPDVETVESYLAAVDVHGAILGMAEGAKSISGLRGRYLEGLAVCFEVMWELAMEILGKGSAVPYERCVLASTGKRPEPSDPSVRRDRVAALLGNSGYPSRTLDELLAAVDSWRDERMVPQKSIPALSEAFIARLDALTKRNLMPWLPEALQTVPRANIRFLL